MRIFYITLLLLTSFQTTAETLPYCDSMSNIAEIIMQERQDNVPKEIALENAHLMEEAITRPGISVDSRIIKSFLELDKLTKYFIEQAYQWDVRKTEEGRRWAVADFKYSAMNICTKTVKHDR